MAAINHTVTEEQLKDAQQAIIAIQKAKGHTHTEAYYTARDLVWLVFRGVITLDSLTRSIVANARKVYVQ